jgi:hypothetical protein
MSVLSLIKAVYGVREGPWTRAAGFRYLTEHHAAFWLLLVGFIPQ